MKFATLLVLTAHKFSSFQVGGCLSLMRRNCPKVFSRKLTLPISHALMLIIISIAIIIVSSLSAPWYVMYVHNPSNDRTYCNRPPGGNQIYLLIFIFIVRFFINITICLFVWQTKRSDFKGLMMQRDELGSNWGDLRLKSNLGFPT